MLAECGRVLESCLRLFLQQGRSGVWWFLHLLQNSAEVAL